MSLELINTLATFGTFLVIAGTAIAAIVQLRHARSSNQIEVLTELRESDENPEMQSAMRFVQHDLSTKLEDPAFRYQVLNLGKMTAENQPAWTDIRRVGNFYENMGTFVSSGLADEALVLKLFTGRVLRNWEQLAPVLAIRRRISGDGLWENFEYLTVLAQDWMAAHPKGTYPAGARRVGLRDEWLEADKQYAASLAPV
jgi:Domain of unknown function (DUF4760)